MMKPKPIPELTKSDKKRFWTKVDKTPGHGPNGDCWEWTAYVYNDYGKFSLCKPYLSHRISYVLKYGQVPDGLLVLHKCDNTRCVNPDHLFAGSHKDNMVDMVNKGRAHRPKGADNGNSKFIEHQVLEIRCKYARGGISQTALAQEHGVSDVAIGHIINRKSWEHLPQNEDEVIDGPFYSKGADRWNSKLTEEQVLEIRSRYATGGITQTVLAQEYGVSRRLIGSIVNRKHWTHI